LCKYLNIKICDVASLLYLEVWVESLLCLEIWVTLLRTNFE